MRPVRVRLMDEDCDNILVEPAADRCLEREGPAWGLDGAFEVVPGRRRGLVGLEV